MPLGILEDHKLEHVPGTAPLNELGNEAFNHSGVDSRILKHDPTGKILLVPQPSDSQNDPYNWPRMKKELFTVAFAFSCGAVGGMCATWLCDIMLIANRSCRTAAQSCVCWPC